MAGKLNGTLKQWWPVVVAVVLLAVAWGTLRADVTHNQDQIETLQSVIRDVRESLGTIQSAVANIEGMLQEREKH